MTKFALVQIGTARTIPYSFCGDVFSHWIGTTTQKAKFPNYLGILAIGWYYILSARLVEMHGDSAVIRYTNSRADCLGESPCNPSEDVYFLDVGETNQRVHRWWSAILAKREGWIAIVKDTLSDEFVAPWSASRTCKRLLSSSKREARYLPCKCLYPRTKPSMLFSNLRV